VAKNDPTNNHRCQKDDSTESRSGPKNQRDSIGDASGAEEAAPHKPAPPTSDQLEQLVTEDAGAQAMMARRDELPIAPYLGDIRRSVEQADVTIVIADRGAGKSSQVPQVLGRAGYTVECTQPTRVAAMSLQREVEAQYGGANGELVGWHTGRSKLGSDESTIMYCTDGLLLEKMLNGLYNNQSDSDISKVVIIIDEFHIGNLNIETIIAKYKRLREQGSVPKLVIMSATMDVTEVARFLDVADQNIFKIQGRQFEIRELKRGQSRLDDVLDALAAKDGSVLDFYEGEGEIRMAIAALEEYKHGAIITPLHGKQSAGMQNKAIRPSPGARYIPATNIAATSLTIPDVAWVIDGGWMRISLLTDDPSGDELALKTVPVDQATRLQRSGRCGRTKDGCYIYWGQPPEDLPAHYWEIQHGPLYKHFLKLVVAGEDPLTLEFLHDPGSARRKATMNWLERHGFIDKVGDSERYVATVAGKFVASLPLNPREAMMLYASLKDYQFDDDQVGCLIDIAAIANVRDFRTSSSIDLADEVVEGDCRRVARRSENVTNLCALEALFKQESDPEKRLALCEHYGIREDAVTEILQNRQEIARELNVQKIKPIGTRKLHKLLTEPVLEASVGNWSDHIYHYVGKDDRGNAMYQKVGDSEGDVRYLDRYRVVGSPNLVIGKPLMLDLHPGQKPSRLIVEVAVVPPRWFSQVPKLNELDRRVAQLRRDLEKDSAPPVKAPSKRERETVKRHDKRSR
jgi:HrpA-like RNA helicase